MIGKSEVRTQRGGISVPKMESTAFTLSIMIEKVIKKELEGRIKIHMVKSRLYEFGFVPSK